ncbi:unnamed protein product [Dibothriocephalus latus]|uniref:Uncharacterized protein n=1 Tax=Dibothriocephalus latus TaxID=60516 RepID=A0A3P6TQR2_DIBLA|nr:unnamed protein product [Dibothriocephalus latus]
MSLKAERDECVPVAIRELSSTSVTISPDLNQQDNELVAHRFFENRQRMAQNMVVLRTEGKAEMTLREHKIQNASSRTVGGALPTSECQHMDLEETSFVSKAKDKVLPKLFTLSSARVQTT